MEDLQDIYVDQTKIIETLYKESFKEALEYVDFQIEKYGDFARGLLLFLIEISSDEELDEIITIHKDACFTQRLRTAFTRKEESMYQRKYYEIVEKINRMIEKTKPKKHITEALSISKYVSDGNAVKVHELLELGESPHSLVNNIPIIEYAQQCGNQQVIDEINKYLGKEEMNKIRYNTISISEMVEKLNSSKYTNFEKLSFILSIKPNIKHTETEIDSIVSIIDDKLIESLYALYYEKNRTLIIKLIENKRFKLAFELISKSGTQIDNLSYYIMEAKIVITSKDLKKILETDNVTKNNINFIEILQMVEEGNLEKINSLPLCTTVYHLITVGSIIGRMADLETIKVISAKRNTKEIAELILGAILLDKKDCFDYLTSLPINMPNYGNYYFVLKAQRYEYAEALANLYPNLRISPVDSAESQISGFWEYSKDLPNEHPLFSVVGPSMVSFVNDVPNERVSLLIEQSNKNKIIKNLINTSLEVRRFDIAAILLKTHKFEKLLDYIPTFLEKWTGSDGEKEFYKVFCQLNKLKSKQFLDIFIEVAQMKDIQPLEIMLSEPNTRKFIHTKEIKCAKILLLRYASKVIDSIHDCFTQKGIWMIGATSPEIFMERYKEIKAELTEEQIILIGMMAIYNNQHDNLKFLLSNGLNPNSKGKSPFKINKVKSTLIYIGESTTIDFNEFLLIFAVINGDFESFTILLNAGADLNVQNNQGESIYLTALKAGRQDIFEYLMNNKVEIDNKEINALLEASCMKGYMSYANYFIDLGANPINEECLLQAVKGKHIEIAKMLMESGCRPTDRILQAACKTGFIPMIDLLFEFGYGTDSYTEYDDKVEVVDALIRHGVDIRLSDEYRSIFNAQLDRFINQKTISFISSGTDLSMFVFQLLYWEKIHVPSFFISVLLDTGVDANLFHEGRSLLSLACLHRNPGAVKLLLERGAAIERTSPYKKNSKEKKTPLVIACKVENNREVVKCLLENGADTMPDSSPPDAFYYGAQNKYDDLLLPYFKEKEGGNKHFLAEVFIWVFKSSNDLDRAVNVFKYFMKKQYSEQGRLIICSMATIDFDLVKRLIAAGLTFKGFNVSNISIPDVAALCIEAGASVVRGFPSFGAIRTVTAMGVDVNLISNTEEKMFFIRRLPEDEIREVYMKERRIEYV